MRSVQPMVFTSISRFQNAKLERHAPFAKLPATQGLRNPSFPTFNKLPIPLPGYWIQPSIRGIGYHEWDQRLVSTEVQSTPGSQIQNPGPRFLMSLSRTCRFTKEVQYIAHLARAGYTQLLWWRLSSIPTKTDASTWAGLALHSRT